MADTIHTDSPLTVGSPSVFNSSESFGYNRIVSACDDQGFMTAELGAYDSFVTLFTQDGGYALVIFGNIFPATIFAQQGGGGGGGGGGPDYDIDPDPDDPDPDPDDPDPDPDDPDPDPDRPRPPGSEDPDPEDPDPDPGGDKGPTCNMISQDVMADNIEEYPVENGGGSGVDNEDEDEDEDGDGDLYNGPGLPPDENSGDGVTMEGAGSDSSIAPNYPDDCRAFF